MNHTHDHDEPHDHEHEVDEQELDESAAEFLNMALDRTGQVFLEMRGQNTELLRLAADIAGYTQEHAPLKPAEIRQALKAIWDVYTEFYQWVDPEDVEDDEDDEEEDED